MVGKDGKITARLEGSFRCSAAVDPEPAKNEVRAIFDGDNPLPIGISISAKGRAIDIGQSVLNRELARAAQP